MTNVIASGEFVSRSKQLNNAIAIARTQLDPNRKTVQLEGQFIDFLNQNRMTAEQLYANIDSNNNGVIDPVEFRESLIGLTGLPMPNWVTDMMFASMDIDGTGIITHDNLMGWLGARGVDLTGVMNTAQLIDEKMKDELQKQQELAAEAERKELLEAERLKELEEAERIANENRERLAEQELDNSESHSLQQDDEYNLDSDSIDSIGLEGKYVKISALHKLLDETSSLFEQDDIIEQNKITTEIELQSTGTKATLLAPVGWKGGVTIIATITAIGEIVDAELPVDHPIPKNGEKATYRATLVAWSNATRRAIWRVL